MGYCARCGFKTDNRSIFEEHLRKNTCDLDDDDIIEDIRMLSTITRYSGIKCPFKSKQINNGMINIWGGNFYILGEYLGEDLQFLLDEFKRLGQFPSLSLINKNIEWDDLSVDKKTGIYYYVFEIPEKIDMRRFGYVLVPGSDNPQKSNKWKKLGSDESLEVGIIEDEGCYFNQGVYMKYNDGGFINGLSITDIFD
jgi:hypothetical protein